MTFPADGGPRFVARELDAFPMGNLEANRGGGNAVTALTVAILDRAYCHRVVREFRGKRGGPMKREQRRATIRAAAATTCRDLNAWDAATHGGAANGAGS